MANEPKKIMIIEDDRFLSSLMKARLEKEGFLIAQAFDGEEAMQALKTELPALIILDLIMPQVTGFEVLQTISITPQLGQSAGRYPYQSRAGFRHQESTGAGCEGIFRKGEGFDR